MRKGQNEPDQTADLRNLIDSIPGGIAVYKLSNSIETLYFNDSVPAATGYTREEYEQLLREDSMNPVYLPDRPLLTSALTVALTGKQRINLTYRICHKSGRLIWIFLCAVKVGSEDGCPIFHAVFMDVSEAHQEQKKLRARAERDSLTGLFNRISFEKRIDAQLAKADDYVSAFLMFDVDNFKQINDLFGHTRGDASLCKIAHLLAQIFGAENIAARMGGDEFAVFVFDVNSIEGLNASIEQFCNAVNSIYCCEDQKIRLSCSVGIALAPMHGADFHTLYMNADKALLVAKNSGKNQAQLFDDQMKFPSAVVPQNMEWLLNETSNAIYVCNADTYELLYLNKPCGKLVGVEETSYLGTKCYETLMHQKAPCAFCRMPQMGTKTFLEREFVLPDSGTPLFLKGKILNWSGVRAHVEFIMGDVPGALAKQAHLREAQAPCYIDEMPTAFFVLKTTDTSEININHVTFDYCNHSFATLLHKTPAEIIGKKLLEVYLTRQAIPMSAFSDVFFRGKSCHYERETADPNKRCYSIDFFSSQKGHCACTVRDVTQIHTLKEQSLQALERENKLLADRNAEQERYAILAAQTGSIVFEWNSEKQRFYCSDNIKEFVVGQSSLEALFSSFPNTESVHPEDRVKFAVDFLEKISGDAAYAEATVRLKKVSGEYLWCKLSANCLRGDDGHLLRAIGAIKDVNNEVDYLNQLKYDAKFDAVTGIYNKLSFYQYSAQLLTDYPLEKFSIVRIDINRFKIINELFGVDEGDRLLTYIGQQLKSALLPFDRNAYGRLEGDIFCACIPNDPEKTDRFIRTLECMGEHYPLDFDIVPSIGIYRIEDPSLSIAVMCDRAKLALQTIKGNYLIRHAYFDEKLSLNLKREQEIVNAMNAALEQGQFQVYLQPKYHLHNGTVCGAEALVRWIRPGEMLLYPNDFIPVFERNGFIMKLDAYMWESVCQLLRRWLDEGKRPLPISVNISKVNLYNPQLCETIIHLVEKYRIPPELFQLELTESTYTDNKKLLKSIMTRLQDYGFIMMMDDFGSGYSSLNMLKEIPVDVLKIDLRFLSDETAGSGRGRSILSSVVRMAKWLDLQVIAEGIETKEQSDFLRSIGCPDGQGYYFSKPIPVAAYEKLIDLAEIEQEKTESLTLQSTFDIDEIWAPSAQVNLLFNSIVNAIAIYEMQDNKIEILRVNDGYYNLTGYDRETVYGRDGRMDRLVYEEDYADSLSIFQEAIENKNAAQGAYRRYKKDGSLMWIRLKLKYLTQVGDRHIFYGALNDISNEKKIEQELQQAHKKLELQFLHELRYRQAIVAKSVAYFELDLTEDKLLEMNKTNSFLPTAPDAETFNALAKRVAARVHPQDRAEFLDRVNREKMLALYSAGTFQLVLEHRISLKPGANYSWIEGTFSMFCSAENSHVLCIWTGKSIDVKAQYNRFLNDCSEPEKTQGSPASNSSER